jgi:AcrR family transcriptional regulator
MTASAGGTGRSQEAPAGARGADRQRRTPADGGGTGRAGLNPERVVAEAAALADERGIQALSLAPLAERLGVRVPSLYKHVRGLDDLHRRLALAGLRDLAEALGAATVGRSGRDALLACATAWRAYAKAHPGRYGAIQRAPDPADAELVAAASRLTELVYAILRGYGLDDEQTVHATRAVRSALHGFVTLEAAGGFGLPQDVDVSYARLVDLLDSGLG